MIKNKDELNELIENAQKVQEVRSAAYIEYEKYCTETDEKKQEMWDDIRSFDENYSDCREAINEHIFGKNESLFQGTRMNHGRS